MALKPVDVLLLLDEIHVDLAGAGAHHAAQHEQGRQVVVPDRRDVEHHRDRGLVAARPMTRFSMYGALKFGLIVRW